MLNLTGFRLTALFTFTTAALALSPQSLAEEDHHHQHAHSHGQARLQVAIEGNSAELILRSPAANLLGFEHEPRTEQQKKLQQETRDWLAATPLVHGEGNPCTVADSAVHHQHGDGDDDNHSDYEVTQQLTCDSQISGSLVTPLAEHFPDIERLSVEWVSEDGQGHVELRGGDDRISLGR